MDEFWIGLPWLLLLNLVMYCIIKYEDYSNLERSRDYWIKNWERADKDFSELWGAVEKHATAEGHNRCWLNDVELYKVWDPTFEPNFKLPCKTEFLGKCDEYYEQQRG